MPNEFASSRICFTARRMDECRSSLEKLSSPLRHDRDVVQLDLAMATLLDGEAKKAELLSKRDAGSILSSRKRIDGRESHLDVDRRRKTRAYAGESYEKILIHAFL